METKNLRYLAILFGGILIVDWLLSFGLTTDATYHLTKASIDAAVVVAVVGFIFRSRLNLKIVLIATGLLSVSLIFWLFSVSNARAVSHVTRPQPHPDTDWGPEEPPEEVVIDSVERSDRIWRVVLHSPSKEFVITWHRYTSMGGLQGA